MGADEDIKAGASWTKTARQPRIAIIGAGISGVGAVIKLRKSGYTDLTVFEKADEVGGTWRENRYPGLSCDVPSYWYSYSFEPNPDWSYRFSYGPEILDYIKQVARKYDVYSAIRFGSPVTELKYLGPQWSVTVDGKAPEIFDFIVSATGILHHPKFPDIEGLASFTGDMFHSAEWNDAVSLEGKRVGIIGTGSTSAQITGEIASKVGHMTVFQRTPHWMVPMPQKKYSVAWKAFCRVFPFVPKLVGEFYKWGMLNSFADATVGNMKKQAQIEKACLKHLEESVPDPELRQKLTPDYKAACKRLILCSDFYKAISSDNATLVTSGISHIEPGGVRTDDGELHELDVLILATGFQVTDFILPTRVYGEDGRELSELWGGAPRAHRAMAIPGFPNFWMLEGPTGPVGNLSLISITECQLDYLVQCLDKMKGEKLDAFCVSQEAFDDFNRQIAEAMPKTVWASGGCDSWYIDESGQPNLYPWHPREFYKSMQQVDFSEYRLIREVEGNAA